MKNLTTLVIILSFLTFITKAQVGIGTTSPTKELDIDGELRIRTTEENRNETAAKDSILVVDKHGNVNRTTSKQVVSSYLKTLVKGYFISSSIVNLNLISSRVLIPFNDIEFDLNSEFDNHTHTFTAKQEGIYSINVQIKSNASLGVATNFGVAIAKNGTIISRNSFANISLLGIKVTPPIRYLETLVQLAEGDTINFNILSDLSNVSILGTSEDCFFTIQQVR